MTVAISSPALNDQVQPVTSAPPFLLGLYGVVGWCAIQTVDGRLLSRGSATVFDPMQPERICVTDLTRPGDLLDAYIGRGVRRFLLDFDGGPLVVAELVRTSWRQVGGRLCCFLVRTGRPE